jgi:hypothetical protein
LKINGFFDEFSNSVITGETNKSLLGLLLHLSVDIGASIIDVVLVPSVDINEVVNV